MTQRSTARTTKYGRHQKFEKLVMLKWQQMFPNTRLWPQATGHAYAIPAVKNLIKAAFTLNLNSIRQAVRELRLIAYGKKGAGDLTGITSDGRRIECEIKTGQGKQNKDQEVFEKVISDHNGIYFVISNNNDVDEQLIKIGSKHNLHVVDTPNMERD
jgi:hypothetical protein